MLPAALSTLHRFFRPIPGALLDLVYPPICIACSHRVVHPTLPLCPLCTAALPRADAGEVRQRLDHQSWGHGLDVTFALWQFDRQTIVQRLQHALKYGNRPDLGVTLGRWIGSALPEELRNTEMVVPVPLSRAHLYERGYNQSARLAQGIGAVTGWPVWEDAATRTRLTRSQTRLSEAARWKNVDGAFMAKEEAVQHRRVLLVDDVLTTGATLCACAAAISQAGAASVSIAVLGLAGR